VKGLQAVTLGDLRSPGSTAAEGGAFLRQLAPGGAMDGAADAAARQ